MHQCNNKRIERKSAWAKLVDACTCTLGAFYNNNGTVLRSANMEKAEGVDQDVEFASLIQRTHYRMRHRETIRQNNIESFLSKVAQKIPDVQLIKNIDPDWVSFIFNYIQDTSNTAMQELWITAMIYELEHPGSISKRSLEFLHTCDAWEIAAFKKIAAFVFIGSNGHPFIFRSERDLLTDDPLFSENRLLSHCVSAGLVAYQTSSLTVGFRFNYLGEYKEIQQGFAPKGTHTGYYIQHFSKTGSDLYKLLTTKETPVKNGLRRRQVWDFLTDFLDIENTALNAANTA